MSSSDLLLKVVQQHRPQALNYPEDRYVCTCRGTWHEPVFHTTLAEHERHLAEVIEEAVDSIKKIPAPTYLEEACGPSCPMAAETQHAHKGGWILYHFGGAR